LTKSGNNGAKQSNSFRTYPLTAALAADVNEWIEGVAPTGIPMVKTSPTVSTPVVG